ncbi:MAG: hypothetical protein U0457_20225 [Candidatus Sericytochromatia bacterium]
MSAEQKPNQEKIIATIRKHEKLIELAKKLNPFGKITEVIFATLSDVVSEEEKILFCHSEMQIGQKYLPNGTSVPGLYSFDLTVLTNKNFLKLVFLQTSHTVTVKNVDHIGSINYQTLFGSQYDIEEDINAEDKGFVPSHLKLSIDFNNQKGEKTVSLELDIMEENSIKSLMPQIKFLSQNVGKPLLSFS